MNESLEIRKKRLLYQCWYRGCRETDKIFGHFARANMDSFSAEEVDELEVIMHEQDTDLFNWISGREPMPEHMLQNSVMKRLAVFDLASITATQPL